MAKSTGYSLSGPGKRHNSVEAGDAMRLLEQHTELPVARVGESPFFALDLTLIDQTKIIDLFFFFRILINVFI
jgi:hypothetical protein